MDGYSLESKATGHPETAEAGPALTWRGVIAYGSERRADGGRLLLGEALTLLPPEAGFVVSHRLVEPGAPARTSVALGILGVGAGQGRDVGRLDQLLALAFPEVRFGTAKRRADVWPVWRDIRPEALDLSIDRQGTGIASPRLVGRQTGGHDIPLVSATIGRELDVAAALKVLAIGGAVELRLSTSRLVVDARVRRAVDWLRERLAAGDGSRDGLGEAADGLFALSGELLARGGGIRIDVSAGFAEPPSQLTIDLASLALFGVPAAHVEPGPDRIDLRGAWPRGGGLPSLLPPAIAALRSGPSPEARERARGSLVLGLDSAEAPVRLTPTDRARHLFVIGATGTGKSTFMLNLLAQDFAAGEGVILLDPHGDLADEARALVPARRRDHLIFADAADLAGRYAFNLLAGQGGDPARERNYVANSFIRIFTRVLYAGVPDAFGPMFETYFRNALLLLMEADGDQADLLDFDAIFHDAAYRRDLVGRCTDAKVVEFWTKVAPAVTNDETSLANIAPYITSKLAQFTGNPLMRGILSGGDRALDLAAAMNEGRIVIFKAAKGLIGQSDAELLAALTVMQIAKAGMARAAVSPDHRRPVRVYIDEFQTCAGEGLADLLAEARKFGISLVLANQSMGQVDGSGRRPDTGAAALANAANLIAFRVGAPDAARLGPWFAPDVNWPALCRLPDFHAYARVLDHGRPAPAAILSMAPPPGPV